jgi:hypothetical protein
MECHHDFVLETSALTDIDFEFLAFGCSQAAPDKEFEGASGVFLEVADACLQGGSVEPFGEARRKARDVSRAGDVTPTIEDGRERRREIKIKIRIKITKEGDYDFGCMKGVVPTNFAKFLRLEAGEELLEVSDENGRIERLIFAIAPGVSKDQASPGAGAKDVAEEAFAANLLTLVGP